MTKTSIAGLALAFFLLRGLSARAESGSSPSAVMAAAAELVALSSPTTSDDGRVDEIDDPSSVHVRLHVAVRVPVGALRRRPAESLSSLVRQVEPRLSAAVLVQASLPREEESPVESVAAIGSAEVGWAVPASAEGFLPEPPVVLAP